MPRKTRKQPGPSGGAYENRTDLSIPTQGVQTPTGLPYGQAQALEQSQQQQGVAGDPYAKILAAAQAHSFQPVQINAPTERPQEPVTAGLSRGPGPGPEALGLRRGLSDILASAYGETGNETLGALMDRARQMGL